MDSWGIMVIWFGVSNYLGCRWHAVLIRWWLNTTMLKLHYQVAHDMVSFTNDWRDLAILVDMWVSGKWSNLVLLDVYLTSTWDISYPIVII